MDPLSITTAVLAIGTLAAQTCSAFSNLRSTCEALPGRLHALNNEVADFEIVIYQVADVIKERAGLATLFEQQTDLLKTLERAEIKLHLLNNLIDTLTIACGRVRIPLVKAHVWRKEQERLQDLQNDIKTCKSSLNLMLGASSSRDMIRVRLDVEAISTVTLRSAQAQNHLRDDIVGYFMQHEDKMMQAQKQVDDRISSIERLLQAQSGQMAKNIPIPESSLAQYNPIPGPLAYKRRRSSEEKVDTQKTRSPASEGVGIRLSQYTCACRVTCPCACHVARKAATPSTVDRVLGQLFVGYAGLPLVSPKCDADECEKKQLPNVSVEYWFPMGFCWSQIIRLQVGFSPSLGPQWQLKTLRRVSDTAQCVTYALNGNISGLKDLFKRGAASPQDVSTTRGYSILRQNFTELHKIVLRLSMMDLQEQILLNLEDVNATDAMGRTPLTWAAARGDDDAVAVLLGFGADPNILDQQFTGPVSYAAERDRAVCVRLLLEAGAAPDPALPKGVVVGTGLNCAARNARNPLVLKTLLDFGADIEAMGADKKTSLHHVARTDNVSFAMLLLDYGANINATSVDGLTPLTTAIAHGSHQVLQLLLDRWFEFSSCPRLKGPNLLEFVALYADIETMTILTATDHFEVKYDSHYTHGDFVEVIKNRGDASDKLLLASNDLLSVIKLESDLREADKAGLMESGLLSRHRSYFKRFEDWPTSESSLSEAFEEALESLRMSDNDDEAYEDAEDASSGEVSC